MAKSRKWQKYVIFLLILAAAAALWRFWPRHALAVHDKASMRPPVSVKALTVKASDFQAFNEFAGTVQSLVTVQVSARIVAHIQELAVHAGSFVKKGDLLVRLDDGDIRARMKQTQSLLAAAEATRDEAQRDFMRYQDLVKNNIEPRQKLEQAEARAKNAAAAVETAHQQLVEVNETLSYSEIKSSFDAVVVEKFAEPGDLAAPNRVLLTLQDPGRLRVEAPVSEQCARRIHLGDMVMARVASTDTELETRVSEIFPNVDPKSRSFLVRANLPRLADIKPGMFGRLRFPCTPRRLLVVPRAAIASRGQLDMVFVVANGHARLRIIRLGEEQKGNVEILSGLSDGEVVVVSPPETLYDGDAVVVMSEDKQ
jgi:RND family efflux transporter MFP subunit